MLKPLKILKSNQKVILEWNSVESCDKITKIKGKIFQGALLQEEEAEEWLNFKG